MQQRPILTLPKFGITNKKNKNDLKKQVKN